MKFTVSFSESTHDVLVDLARDMDVSLSEVIREALSVFWWISREQSAGSRLLIQRGDEVTELVISSLARSASEAITDGHLPVSVVVEPSNGQQSPRS